MQWNDSLEERLEKHSNMRGGKFDLELKSRRRCRGKCWSLTNSLDRIVYQAVCQLTPSLKCIRFINHFEVLMSLRWSAVPCRALGKRTIAAAICGYWLSSFWCEFYDSPLLLFPFACTRLSLLFCIRLVHLALKISTAINALPTRDAY